jgi:hypothetical protein
VCECDVVSAFPKFGVMYKHAGREVVIDRRGNVVADASYVERFFSPSRSSVKDHRLDAYRGSLRAALTRFGVLSLVQLLALPEDADVKLVVNDSDDLLMQREKAHASYNTFDSNNPLRAATRTDSNNLNHDDSDDVSDSYAASDESEVLAYFAENDNDDDDDEDDDDDDDENDDDDEDDGNVVDENDEDNARRRV